MSFRYKPGNDSGRRAQTLSRPLHSSSHGYPAAAATARFSLTLTRCARYSAEAWRSLLSPTAETFTLPTTSAEKLPPIADFDYASGIPERTVPVTPTRKPSGPFAPLPPTRAYRHTVGKE